MDLTNPRLMYLKAALFLLLGLLSAALILAERPTVTTVLLLLLVIWAFSRAYYFAFYVIEHYIDPTYKFAGLTSFLKYLLSRPKSPTP